MLSPSELVTGVRGATTAAGPPVVSMDIRALHYGAVHALRDVRLEVEAGTVTAFIGPSGCGKSSALRTINRMNDFVPGFRLDGRVSLHGHDIYHRAVDPVAVRRRVGVVFQQPNPFVGSIYHNVAFGLKLNGYRGDIAARVEDALRATALWDEVKDRLRSGGHALSIGQQQRLCIARAIATRPEVLLMDEPCSSLDPLSTRRIEELVLELRREFTVIMVTHNMDQARRVADTTAFFCVDTSTQGRCGYLVEHGRTAQIFEQPASELTRRYLSGDFG